MKKLALAIAFAFAFGVLSLAYGYYRQKKTEPSETPCASCSVSGDVHSVGSSGCSVSCPKGYIPECLPAEFGVRPVAKCRCVRQ